VQLHFHPGSHHDVREMYRLMSDRYRREGRIAEAERYARMSQPQ